MDHRLRVQCPKNRWLGLQRLELPHHTNRVKEECFLYLTLDPAFWREPLKALPINLWADTTIATMITESTFYKSIISCDILFIFLVYEILVMRNGDVDNRSDIRLIGNNNLFCDNNWDRSQYNAAHPFSSCMPSLNSQICL